ncbi:MAG: 23S rRNA (pseudouridine(1915)-N(3))-methyltransferase RlmH [Ruminococcaceae bacterium]|nr:23S rRNA (pseudouridine(1915)-N(3))-methyltransferase RlmH [Oscillospiraceae bacterium]
MLQINILYVGNIKDKFFAQAVAEYEKRLSGLCKIKNIELKEEKPPDNPSESEIALIIRKEGDRLMENLPKKGYKIALCVEGTQISSEALAQKIESVAVSGDSEITFIIGGAFGMDERVKKAANYRLSISKMTFTHRMMRVILIEQIYRALNILSGGHYHK